MRTLLMDGRTRRSEEKGVLLRVGGSGSCLQLVGGHEPTQRLYLIFCLTFHLLLSGSYSRRHTLTPDNETKQEECIGSSKMDKENAWAEQQCAHVRGASKDASNRNSSPSPL